MLAIASDDGTLNDYIPAGAWPTYTLDQAASFITFTVVSILPNPPVQFLLPTYYVPGETVPEAPRLGNSPIGISGQINMSSVQTLSNEGNPVNTLVIDMGDTAFSQIVAIFNDGHALWAVDQSGTKHQVLKIQSAGNPLQLGQTGDTSEVLGDLLTDGKFTIIGVSSLDNGAITTDGTGHITLPNNKGYQAKTAGGVAQNILYIDVTNGTNLQAAALGGIVYIDDQDTTTIAYFSKGTGLQLVSNARIGTAITGDIIDAASATATYIKSRNAGGSINFQTPNGTTQAYVDSAGIHSASGNAVFFSVGSFTGVSRFTGTGNGTVATGLTNPFSIVNDACTLSGSSQTLGITIASSSVVTTGAGLAWHGTAYN